MADLAEELSLCKDMVAKKQQEIKLLKAQTEGSLKCLNSMSR